MPLQALLEEISRQHFRIVASEATGEITLDGKGLHATTQWRDRRRSVALNPPRLVLFDIAAMLCAVEGASDATRFFQVDL